MCVLCKDWILETLDIREVRKAAVELMTTAKTEEELEHIMDRLSEIENLETKT